MTANILGEIDWAFARGEFSRKFDCCIPELRPERAVCLNEVRHPLLQVALKRHEAASYSAKSRTQNPQDHDDYQRPQHRRKDGGPESSGHRGADGTGRNSRARDEVKLPLFSRVLADIGDQQSIEANLSTFSAHVTNIEAMAKMAGPGDLVLLDEIGSSTEPNEGAALAVAILEHFRERGAITMVTTHHSRLKAYAAETAGGLKRRNGVR